MYNTLLAIGRLMYRHTQHPVFKLMGRKLYTIFISRTRGQFDDLTE